MRRSRKPQRDALAFAACQSGLAQLRAAEARGELALYYADEVRFSRYAPVPYAWQRRGQPPVGLPAERGAGGYSVLGLWRPGAESQPFQGWLSATAFTAELFVSALDEFSRRVRQPTVLVLDNASVHRAARVKARQPEWAARGLRLLFLPPYSPELNRIEMLWRFCKHYWLPPAAYQSAQTLRDHVTKLIQKIGTQHYRITFG
jgi:transposase